MPFDTLPDSRLLRRSIMDEPEVYRVAGGAVAMFSNRSPGRQDDNQDGAALIVADTARAVIAVADGLGGQRGGAEAADLALTRLTECVTAAAPAGGALRGAILDAFERANSELTASGAGAATTLAVAEIDGTTVRPYHVGDSTITVVGQRAKLKLCTVSHSPVGYAVEAGLLSESEAIHHEDRHLVSNIVGSPDMRIEVGHALTLRPRDTMVLGSDGLFDNLRVPEIVEIVRKGPLERCASELAGACRARMDKPQPDHPSKLDDLTFVLYRRAVAR